jgi:predicted GNAT superfamily acetyltransferase
MEEYRACVALQEDVWGKGFSERVPAAILMVSQRLGGVAAGAWNDVDELVGFVFGMTGWKGGEPFHWSDMLAVRPGLRGSGLGLRLKAYQREVLLEGGVGVAHWTFDPLESRNAWVNLGRLGAVAREYVEDMYGQSDSHLHRGIGTDRLVVTWEMASPRVAARMDRGEAPPGPEALEDVPRALEVREQEGFLRPVPGSAPGETRKLRVPIPPDLQALKDRDPGLAREWRLAVREALAPRLARGWEVRELIRHGNLSEYLVILKED